MKDIVKIRGRLFRHQKCVEDFCGNRNQAGFWADHWVLIPEDQALKEVSEGRAKIEEGGLERGEAEDLAFDACDHCHGVIFLGGGWDSYARMFESDKVPYVIFGNLVPQLLDVFKRRGGMAAFKWVEENLLPKHPRRFPSKDGRGVLFDGDGTSSYLWGLIKKDAEDGCLVRGERVFGSMNPAHGAFVFSSSAPCYAKNPRPYHIIPYFDSEKNLLMMVGGEIEKYLTDDPRLRIPTWFVGENAQKLQALVISRDDGGCRKFLGKFLSKEPCHITHRSEECPAVKGRSFSNIKIFSREVLEKNKGAEIYIFEYEKDAQRHQDLTYLVWRPRPGFLVPVASEGSARGSCTWNLDKDLNLVWGSAPEISEEALAQKGIKLVPVKLTKKGGLS